jgi:hypothetical protein
MLDYATELCIFRGSNFSAGLLLIMPGVQTMRDVAELCKYYSRSMHLGYQRLTKGSLTVQKEHESLQYSTLAALWGPQRQKSLEIVTVCFPLVRILYVRAHLNNGTLRY